jgi:hypothetical protein
VDRKGGNKTMSILEDFNKCINNDWITSPLGVQYAVKDNTLYFQCSRDAQDWKYNLMFPVSAYKNGQGSFLMHMGFKTLWHDVRDAVATLSFKNIRGYSQGAVFACMAHEDRLFNHGFVCDTVVFGSPKFLFMPSEELKERFSGVLRIENADDVVTKVPPFYTHIGESLTLPGKGKRPKDMKLINYLSGHDPYQYRNNLEDL